jgi:hypothetical protein
MASHDSIISLKRHSHPALGALSLVAIVLSSVALVKSCPPVPAPAGAPAKVEEKPVAVAPVVAPASPVVADVAAPAVVTPVAADAKAPVVDAPAAPVSK